MTNSRIWPTLSPNRPTQQVFTSENLCVPANQLRTNLMTKLIWMRSQLKFCSTSGLLRITSLWSTACLAQRWEEPTRFLIQTSRLKKSQLKKTMMARKSRSLQQTSSIVSNIFTSRRLLESHACTSRKCQDSEVIWLSRWFTTAVCRMKRLRL